MKVLPEKEFRELAIKQRLTCPETTVGFIDKETLEATVPVGGTTRIRLHELGHEKLEHFPKVVKFYGKGRKDVLKMYQPWRQLVDDEIEAEIYSFRMMGKKITPKVSMMALRELVSWGWEPWRALSLVIGRLRHYGIETSWKERKEIVKIMERALGEPIKGYEDL